MRIPELWQEIRRVLIRLATVKGSGAKVPVSLRNGSYVLDGPAGVEPSDIDVTATDCAYNATT